MTIKRSFRGIFAHEDSIGEIVAVFLARAFTILLISAFIIGGLALVLFVLQGIEAQGKWY